MPDTIDDILDIRNRMLKLGLCQLSVINLLVDAGKASKDKKSSLTTQLSFALTGKRTTKRYRQILSDVQELLDDIECEREQA